MTTHTALGPALRAWRERIGPAAVGLPAAGNRRVPGLRREELAVLAGLSVDYLVQLEQGRAKNPSPRCSQPSHRLSGSTPWTANCSTGWQARSFRRPGRCRAMCRPACSA
ncbi:helix-turn-helix transcriptional regulator [Streptomyces griseus]|uniref:helix-turn-helix domain-containing protein n=1 Tax=Streptomyces griseus TaxID=1911 RepID=UPI0033D74AD8